jgi:hypothetical protein
MRVSRTLWMRVNSRCGPIMCRKRMGPNPGISPIHRAISSRIFLASWCLRATLVSWRCLGGTKILTWWCRSYFVVFRGIFPSPRDLFHCGSLCRVRIPAPLEELPPFGGEPNFLSVPWKLWSDPFRYPTYDFFTIAFCEWGCAREDLDSKHPKGENIYGRRLQRYPCTRRIENLRGEPPQVPSCWRNCREAGVGIHGGHPVICQSSVAGLIDEDIRLREVSPEAAASGRDDGSPLSNFHVRSRASGGTLTHSRLLITMNKR